MKSVLLGLVLVASQAMAADPAYPTTDLKGFLIQGFEKFENITFVPGKLDSCTSSSFGTSANYNCNLVDTKIQVTISGKTHEFKLERLNAYEQTGTATTPGIMSYYFNGKFSMPLPDGTSFDTELSVGMSRNEATLERMTGNLSIYTLGAAHGLVLNWPMDPIPESAKP